MEHCSALKRSMPSSHEQTWKDLKSMLLCEKRQFEKTIYCIIPFTSHPEKAAARVVNI